MSKLAITCAQGPFKCDICPQEFPQYSQYRKHCQLHVDDKPHKCPQCSMSFNYEVSQDLFIYLIIIKNCQAFAKHLQPLILKLAQIHLFLT